MHGQGARRDQNHRGVRDQAAGTALPLLLRPLASQGVFAWDRVDIDALRALLAASGPGVAAILRGMAADWQAMRDGFPDLMVEKDGAVSFIEVKAEGDAIRRNQLTRNFWMTPSTSIEGRARSLESPRGHPNGSESRWRGSFYSRG